MPECHLAEVPVWHSGRRLSMSHLNRRGSGCQGATSYMCRCGTLGGQNVTSRPTPATRHQKYTFLVPTLRVGTGGGDAPRRGLHSPTSFPIVPERPRLVEVRDAERPKI